MAAFVEAVVENDPAQLELEVYESLEAQFEDWLPAAGNLEVWLTKAYVRLSSIVREQAGEISAAAFKSFGETIAGVPPILATSASVDSTWTMVDNAGYTIPAGTLVAIPLSGNESLGFEVIDEVVVEVGNTATEAGEVGLRAVVPGEEANGLSEGATLIDALAYVESIVLVGPTSGGVDEEDEDAYLERLTSELRNLSLSLIISPDFERDALAVAGVARSLALDGYDAETEASEVPLAVTVFVTDEDGLALSSGIKEELQERQQAKVPAGVTVFVEDPTYTKIDVEVEVVVIPGYDVATVKAAVEAALLAYLSPANWGLPATGDASDSGGWVNATSVYFYEVVSEVDRVPGVVRVKVAKIAKDGNALGTSDVALSGPAPLTKPDTITVAVVA